MPYSRGDTTLLAYATPDGVGFVGSAARADAVSEPLSRALADRCEYNKLRGEAAEAQLRARLDVQQDFDLLAKRNDARPASGLADKLGFLQAKRITFTERAAASEVVGQSRLVTPVTAEG